MTVAIAAQWNPLPLPLHLTRLWESSSADQCIDRPNRTEFGFISDSSPQAIVLLGLVSFPKAKPQARNIG
jgi:hypothetical protein